VQFDAPASDPDPEGFEPWETDAAKAVVYSFMAARGYLRSHQPEDLIQEGLIAWWQQRGKHDPRRASKRTFLNQVITSRLLDLLKAELAEKRTADRSALSLGFEDWDRQREVEDVQAEDPLEVVDGNEFAERIDRARQRLTARQRAVLDGMLNEKTPTKLSRELGTSRVTVHADLTRIRQALEAEGLRDFIE
jgi:RNA polymerase sigma factor (sigma-70 family)